jgi:pilus assembly protein CpaE
MRLPEAQRTETERGQASVEFVGTLPAALLVVLVAWQLVLAGQAHWLAGSSARVAARAQAVGGDPVAAARSALPTHLRRHLEVTSDDRHGRIRVRLRVPFVLGRWSSPLRMAGMAAMEPQTR